MTTGVDIVAGTVNGTTTVLGSRFEVFADPEDEGEIFLGGVEHPFLAPWSVTGIDFPSTPIFNVTATVTDASGNTSEFSTPFAVSQEIPVVGVVGIELR
jgi:hypothetical protein